MIFVPGTQRYTLITFLCTKLYYSSVGIITLPLFHVADGEARQLLRRWRKPITSKDFSQKLHENERNWTEGLGGAFPALLLEPPMVSGSFKLLKTRQMPSKCDVLALEKVTFWRDLKRH